MKYILLILISSLSFGCSNTTEPAVTKKESVSSTYTAIVTESALASNLEEQIDQEEVDCVFDTSTYKFTTEALREYDKNLAFHWDKQASKALVKLNKTDSLILHIGGCNHFTYSATYITDATKFDDREFLIQKAKWLATNFFSNGFDEKYGYCIENNLYKLEEPGRENFLYFTIIDPDPTETNNIYEGWSIEKAGGKTKLNIVGYQN